MAETHIQVNLDGSTEERKTILWPSNKVEQKEVIRSLFMQKGWSVSYINNEGASFWKIKTNSVDKSWNINLYISSIRDESRQPDEFKMQLGTTYPQDFEDGWVTIVLGIYTLDNDKQAYLLSGYDILLRAIRVFVVHGQAVCKKLGFMDCTKRTKAYFSDQISYIIIWKT